MKSQSIAYLLNQSEDIYWILNLEGEVHSIWDLWISGLQECKGDAFLKSCRRATIFGRVQEIWIFWTGGYPCLNLPPRPPTSFSREVDLGRGNRPIWKISRPNQKLLHAHPTSKKPLSLHFWRLTIHKTHIECTSPSIWNILV